jgi:hypothetical protein
MPIIWSVQQQAIGWMASVWNLVGTRDFLFLTAETNFGAHPASYPMCIEGCLPRGKEAAH